MEREPSLRSTNSLDRTKNRPFQLLDSVSLCIVTVTNGYRQGSLRSRFRCRSYDIGTAIGSGLTYTGLTLTAALSPSKPEECVVQIATRDIRWETLPDGTTSAHLTLVAVAMDGYGKTACEHRDGWNSASQEC